MLSALIIAVVPAGGQAPAARKNAAAPKKTAGTWTAPRTDWGDPDLQGTWNNGTITPLERARGAGEKELLSKDEEAEVNEQSETRAERSDTPEDLPLPALPAGFGSEIDVNRDAAHDRHEWRVRPKEGQDPAGR